MQRVQSLGLAGLRGGLQVLLSFFQWDFGMCVRLLTGLPFLRGGGVVCDCASLSASMRQVETDMCYTREAVNVFPV